MLAACFRSVVCGVSGIRSARVVGHGRRLRGHTLALLISNQSGAVFPTNALYKSGKIKDPLEPGKFISLFEALLPYIEQDNLQKNLDLTQREFVNCNGNRPRTFTG